MLNCAHIAMFDNNPAGYSVYIMSLGQKKPATIAESGPLDALGQIATDERTTAA